MRRRLILIFVLLIVFIYYSGTVEVKDLNEVKTIEVEIKGEVDEEKVIELPLGSTLEDALKDINLTDDADLSSFSLLDVLHNKEVIVIPEKKEEVLHISINSADIDELCLLPGIGESIAKRIIEYRNVNGSFNSIEELKNVKGIGDSKFNKIKEYLSL